jgi:hypothetical protein
MALIAHATVEAFFYECLNEALSEVEVDATEDTGFYLVGLLGEVARGGICDEPLAFKLARSTESDPEQRIHELKQVGDTSLVLTGFFTESLERRMVDPDFYIGLGEAAYAELAGRLSASAAFHAVYGELAAKFPRFVDVLHEVRSRVSVVGDDVVALYEQWRRTGSEHAERRLRAAGVLVGDGRLVH